MYPFISQWELARKNPIFCVLLYIIVVLNTQRLGAFVLNIGAFCGNEDIYDMWKLLYYKHFRVGVFFLKKVFECWRLCWESFCIPLVYLWYRIEWLASFGTTIGHLWDIYGLSVAFYKCVSIIMLQKSLTLKSFASKIVSNIFDMDVRIIVFFATVRW